MAYLKAAIAITYYLGCIFKVINVDCNFFSNGMIRIVARFLLTSASRSPSAIAELLVQINIAGSVDQKYTCIGIPQAVLMNASTAIGLYVGLIAILKQVPTTMSPSTDCSIVYTRWRPHLIHVPSLGSHNTSQYPVIQNGILIGSAVFAVLL